MTNIFISLVAFIFAIGILVLFHELGHFSVARLLGVKVLRFSIGFGKPLWRWRDKKNTEYVIAALPFGGYVKMLDEREAPVPEEQWGFTFNRKPIWTRIAIVLAGPVFNFIFAILAYWLMFLIGISGWVPKIGEVLPHSIAAHANLQPHEEIIQVDDETTPTWQQVVKQLMNHIGDNDKIKVQTRAEDQENTYYLDLRHWKMEGKKPNILHSLGIVPFQPPIPPIIHGVLPEGAAGQAGILPGDEIITLNHQPIKEWKQFTQIIAKSAGVPVSIEVKRNDEIKAFTFTPNTQKNEAGEVVGFVGVVVKMTEMPAELIRKERWGFFAAFQEACKKTVDNTLLSLKILGKMLTGTIGLQTLSGPITIAQGAGATASVGLAYYLGFLALISVSLGVLNLLPIPILDGGHLLYYVVELVSGKPVPERVQVVGFKIGMFILLFLMSIAFYNDITRLF